MSITLVCPGCKRSLRARPEFLDRTLQCPSCKTTFKAQTPPDEEPLPVLALAPPQAPRQTNPEDFSPEPRADDQRPSPRATPDPAAPRGPEPRRSRPLLRFPVRVLEDSAGELVGPVEAEVSTDGFRLHGTGQVLFLAPLGTPTKADADELEIALSRRTLRLKVRGPNGRRLAQDVAGFLTGERGPLDSRDYQPRRSPAVVLLTTVVTLLVTAGAGVGGYYLVRSLMAPARVADSAWREFTPPGVEGKLLMPGTPRTQNQNQPGFDGPLRMFSVELKHPNSVFMFGHARLPAWNVGQLTLEQRFEGARQGMLANTKGATFVSQRDIRLGEHPGREYVFDIQKKGKMVVRLYLVGRDLYMLLVGGDGFEANNLDVVKFLNSFRLTGPPERKPPPEPKPRIEPPKPPPDPPRPPIEPPKPPPVPQPPPEPEKPPGVPRPPADLHTDPSPPVERSPIPLVTTITLANVPPQALAFSPDGEVLLSGRDLWRIQDFRLLGGLSVEQPTAAVFDPKTGFTVVSCSGRLFRIDPRTGQDEALDPGPPGGWVDALAISPDGRTLAVHSRKTLTLWDLPARRERTRLAIRSLRWSTGVAFTPDGLSLMTFDGGAVVVLRDPRDGRTRKTVIPDEKSLTAVALRPDGKALAVSYLKDDHCEVHVQGLNGEAGSVGLGTSQAILKVLRYAPTGRFLAGIDLQGNLYLWDVVQGKLIHRFRAHAGEGSAVAFSPDGKLLATCGEDRSTRLWDVSDLIKLKPPPPPTPPPPPPKPPPTKPPSQAPRELFRIAMKGKRLQALALAPDGKKAATCDADGVIRWWDLEKQRDEVLLKGSAQRQVGLAFTLDGKHLLVAVGNEKVRNWDVVERKWLDPLDASGPHVAVFGSLVATSGSAGLRWVSLGKGPVPPVPPHASLSTGPVAFTKGGLWLVGVGRGNVLHAWYSRTGRTTWYGEGHTGRVVALATTRNGARLVSVAEDRTLRIWGQSSPSPRVQVSLPTIPTCLAVSRDSQIVACGGADGRVRYYDMLTGAPRGSQEASANPPPIEALSFGPDNLLVVAAGNTLTGWDINQILTEPGKPAEPVAAKPCLVDVKALTDRGSTSLRLPDGASPRALALSADGAWFAATGSDRVLRIFDVKTGIEKATRAGHEEVRAIAFLSKRGMLVTAANDVIRLRQRTDGRIRDSFDVGGTVEGMGVSPKERVLVLRTSKGTAALSLNPTTPRFELASPIGLSCAFFREDGKEVVFVGRVKEGPDRWKAGVWEWSSRQARSLRGTELAVAADGTLAATVSRGVVQLFAPQDGRTLGEIRAPEGKLHSVVLSPDGKLLVTGGDGVVWLWDPAGRKPKGKFTVPPAGKPVTLLALADDGKLLAAASEGQITLVRPDPGVKPPDPAPEKTSKQPAPEGPPVDVATLEKTGVAEVPSIGVGYPVRWAGFLAEGRAVGMVCVSDPLQGDRRKPITTEVRIWEMPGGRLKTTWKCPGSLAEAAWSADGEILATRDFSGLIRLFDASTGKVLHSFRTAPPVRSLPRGPGMAWSPRGQILVVSTTRSIVAYDWSDQGKGRILESGKVGLECVVFSADGKKVSFCKKPLRGAVKWDSATLRSFGGSFDGEGRAVSSPDGRVLAILADHGLRLTDVQEGKDIGTLVSARPLLGFTFSPDGKTIAGGTIDGRVLLWDVASRKLKAHLPPAAPGRVGFISQIRFSPDGKLLLVGQPNRVWLRRLDRENLARAPEQPLKPRLSLAGGSGPLRPHWEGLFVSRDGKCVALLSLDQETKKPVIRLWEVSEQGRMSERKVPLKGDRIALSPDGRHLAVSARDGTTQIWKVGTAAPVLVHRSTDSRKPPGALVFSPDGKTLICGHPDRIILWDTEQGKVRKTLAINGTLAHGRLSADGKTLTTITSKLENKKAQTVLRIWNLDNDKVEQETRLTFSIGYSYRFFPDDRTVAFWGKQNEVELRPVGKGARGVLRGPPPDQDLITVAVSPDGKWILAGSLDGGVLIWGTRPRTLRARFVAHTTPVSALAVSGDGKTLVTASWDGVGVWDLPVLLEKKSVKAGSGSR
jgi:WD40 repeat protein